MEEPAKMKLLLDTHVWIWAAHRPEKLGRDARRQIENLKNEIYLSPISIWEAHHVARRNRARSGPSFTEWLSLVFQQMPLKEVPFNFAVAAGAAGINLPQSDPGDLFLAATATVFGLTLVTADRQLLDCRWLKTLAAD